MLAAVVATLSQVSTVCQHFRFCLNQFCLTSPCAVFVLALCIIRYTGGMVPDVFQIIVKEKGVFTNVTSPSTKAKLRILFEVAPLALMVEQVRMWWCCCHAWRCRLCGVCA